MLYVNFISIKKEIIFVENTRESMNNKASLNDKRTQ